MPGTAIDSTQLAGLCRAALNTLPRAAIVCDLEKVLFANDAAGQQLRAESADALTGLSVNDLVHSDMHTPGGIRRHLLVESQQPLLGLPAKVYRRDGTTVTALTDARPALFEDRVAIVYSTAPGREESRSTVALTHGRSVVRGDMCGAALEVLPDIVLIHDEELILFANAACRQILAVEAPEDIEGQPINRVVHPDACEAGRERRRLLMEGDRSLKGIPLKVVAFDGQAKRLIADAHPIGFNGSKAGMVVVSAVAG
jgi:PAS domain-containing protein